MVGYRVDPHAELGTPSRWKIPITRYQRPDSLPRSGAGNKLTDDDSATAKKLAVAR